MHYLIHTTNPPTIATAPVGGFPVRRYKGDPARYNDNLPEGYKYVTDLPQPEYDRATHRIERELTLDAWGWRVIEKTEEEIAAETPHPAIAALAAAHIHGIPLPFGDATVYLACQDQDRALFSSALALYRTHEDLLPDEESKAAFRDSTVMFTDASGRPHPLTVTQARQLLVGYGVAYQQLWAAAVAAKAQPEPDDE